jgi:hypothetical protein
MSKLNKKSSKPAINVYVGKSPIKVTNKRVLNFEGGDASMYGKKSRLMLLAMNTFSGEDTFYVKAADRDKELKDLAVKVGIADPDWMSRFLPWLRSTANIRTSAITLAVDVAMAWRDPKIAIPGGRALVRSVLARADEPGEALAYAMSYGRNVPQSIKRGIADAATRLYDEFTLLKYDKDGAAVRFGDVLDLTHPQSTTPRQSALFKHAIDVRHGRGQVNLELLPMLANNKLARTAWNIEGGIPVIPTSEQLKAAGMNWEDVLSILGSKVDKKALWEALIPNMPFMSTLRNLRNFEQAGISQKSIVEVSNRLSDPDQVARSKQFPMRFLSAYRNVVSDAFKYPLDQALQHSLSNIPSLDGRTLILIDTSGSMNGQMSDRSGLKRWDAAVIFGLALAARCEDAQVVSFSDAQVGYSYWSGRTCTGEASKIFPAVKGETLLRGIERWDKEGFFLGAGTDTAGAVNRYFVDSRGVLGAGGHKRIVILTDEEAQTGNPYARVPADVIKIDVNLAGYGHSHAPKETKNLIKLAGLTDSMFTMIPWLEAGLDESWPF